MTKIRIEMGSHVLPAVESVLLTLDGYAGKSLPEKNLDQNVSFLLQKLNKSLIRNEINEIVKHGVDEVLSSWEAFCLLYPREVTSLNCRKILETCVLSRYVISKPDLWHEFEKRWRLINVADIFHRWSYLDFQNLHSQTEKNIEFLSRKYSFDFQEYSIFFSAKKGSPLTGDLRNDLIHFKKVKSWISPKTFSEILRDESNRAADKQFFSWWSSSVHFTPLNKSHKVIKTVFGEFSENSKLNILLEIASFIRVASRLTSNPDFFRARAAQFYYLYLREVLLRDPQGMASRIEEFPEVFRALIGLSLNKITPEQYLRITRFFEE